jgi:hypothetical protein
MSLNATRETMPDQSSVTPTPQSCETTCVLMLYAAGSGKAFAT